MLQLMVTYSNCNFVPTQHGQFESIVVIALGKYQGFQNRDLSCEHVVVW